MDRTRTEGHVDERILVEDALPLRLRVATADGDDGARVARLQRLGVAEVGSQPLEQAADALGVVRVHLAAEGRDLVSAHDGSLRWANWRNFGTVSQPTST